MTESPKIRIHRTPPKLGEAAEAAEEEEEGTAHAGYQVYVVGRVVGRLLLLPPPPLPGLVLLHDPYPTRPAGWHMARASWRLSLSLPLPPPPLAFAMLLVTLRHAPG